jgi:hypothetical protein
MQTNEHRPVESGPTASAQALRAFIPAAIVAVGSAEQPVERLLTLQSAIAKAVHTATKLGRLRLTLPRHILLNLRFR